jgi:hypothetical protein
LTKQDVLAYVAKNNLKRIMIEDEAAEVAPVKSAKPAAKKKAAA